jgi:hypothetical protein
MTYIRRAILALVLSAGLAPAFAQVPPPVPALPDTERRTSYIISGTTCACSVGFSLYGDSTDYQSWVEVFLNGVRVNFNDATFGWTITSPSGPLASLSRPISNGVLTFNSAQTGTVQIVGARRPRRASTFSENRGVPARDLNQILNDMIAQTREIWDKTNDVTGRSILGLPGESIAALPSATARASSFICWDATGLIPMACGPLNGQGNVVGPNSAIDGHIALFSGATGRIIKDGGVIGTGNVTGPASSTNGGFAKWNGASGTLLQDGPVIIPLASGGTNNALTASNGGLVYSDGSGLQVLPGTATANQIPMSGPSSAPGWSTATYPATTVINQLLWSSGANAVVGLVTANNGVLCTSAGGVPSICSSLPAAIQANITTVGTIGSGIWQGTNVGLGFGGTGASTPNAARQSTGLNVWGDQGTGHGDTSVTIGNTERFAFTTAAFTASRAWTLPPASVTGQPYAIQIADMAGGVTGSNTLVITRAGADTINGGATATISATNGGYICTSDGASKWTCQATGAASAGGVTNVTCGTGLAGGTITTSGTCSVSLTTAANSLLADTAISNAVYTDGPSMAQGTAGTWHASGTVTVLDTSGAAQISCKLWDGTTVIDSTRQTINIATSSYSISLSGNLATPAANIRISCTSNAGGATSTFKFNASGNSKDSTITGFRIG